MNRLLLGLAAAATAFDGIVASLLANKYDTIVGSMTITPQR